jgi:hypothetical protein
MNAQLDPVIAALAGLSDPELNAMITMVDDGPQLAPGLFAWVEHVCNWELNRREGGDFQLRPPENAIEPGEMPSAALVLALLRTVFAKDGREGGSAVVRLLEAMMAALGPRATTRTNLDA